jgi:uncharacterized membrane protein/thiol-disulfide isomerase/thioredoxin
MDALLNSLLLRSNVTSFDKNDLYLQLLSHNDYPSIKAVTDTLDYFGIENIAANVPTSALDQMPEYFLALIGSEQFTELVLVKKSKTHIQYVDRENKKFKTTYDEFSGNWTGTLIAIEKEEKKQTTFTRKINVSVVLTIAIIGLAVISIFLDNRDLPESIYLFLALSGLTLSFLTSKEELGIKDKVTTKVCGAISGDKFGCSNVINSREGKIFGILSLADLSLLFFVSVMAYGLTFGLNTTITNALSLASLPVIAYSVYLQIFKLKEFCLLCILTSVVLISQFVLLQFTFTGWEFSLLDMVQFSLVTAVSALIWLSMKKFWKDSNQLTETLREYYSFKRNPELFLSAIKSKRQITLDRISPEERVYFGNKDASIRIISVTNPLCGYCKEPFEVFDKLLQDHPEDIQLTYIFNTAEDAENPATQIALKTIALYQKDKELAYNALKDWYSNKDLENWKKKFDRVGTMLLGPESILKTHRSWCEANEINYTPETMLNSYNFPNKQYKIKDLPLFIEEIRSLNPATKEMVQQ